MTKPIASLSLDLDNKWCYLRTHGVAGWDKYPSYLNVAVPRMLRACEARHLRFTCFVVGRDAAIDDNGDALCALAAAGHELANHTFNHEPWLHTLSRARVESEICMAEELIERVTGVRPIGFRGPGYSVSQDVLEILVERGYLYDASTLPTYIGPLARWYFRQTATREAAQEAQRRELFGSLREGFRSIKPYVWDTAAGPIVEIPVTTFPLLRLPIHMTYLVYLWQFSPRLARTYVRLALAACRLRKVAPSMLLHPLDLLGVEDDPDMRFFPGMTVPREEKMELLDEVLAQLTAEYRLVTLREHAADVLARQGRPQVATKSAAFVAPFAAAADIAD
ncbi:MAG TPA: polysaccharide deacetylase family protein [Lacipirellulaceae bacterium]|jgi:peptidoglycan/xylan/chitin deacetylase (PgdA/CDA1 family)